MSALTLRQNPFFLVLTLVTIVAFLNLIVHVQPTKALTRLEIAGLIALGLAVIAIILAEIRHHQATKKTLEQKIKGAEAEKATIEGKIQAFDTKIDTLNRERSEVDNERRSKYATINRCDGIITAYNECTSPSDRALMQDRYDMAVADKKEAKKAIEKLDLRITHYDLAITIAKQSKEREVPSLEADLRKAQSKLTGLKTEQSTNERLLRDANRRLGIEQGKISTYEGLLPLHEHHAH
ncbi:MAG: hypothetical protein OXP71_10350 [Candidatus Poribacteria bacterium]|nr:hypothetical protein [Candidatus Poribacteria bacterium]